MTQGKYWRFDINSQDQSQQTGSQSSTLSTTGQGQQSGQAFVIVEANDQQTAMSQVKQLLNPSQSQSLGQPTQVDEQQAQQYSSQRAATTA